MKIRQIEPLKFNTQSQQEHKMIYVLIKPYDVCEKNHEEDDYKYHEDMDKPKNKIRGSKLNFLA